ncbi:MAG: glycine--tRNA ligase [Planctomycetes bacterium]|nr:glycine--tRNA ligase [Planctomycetota bacterium]MBI3843321.1 glycine--tRNA ligase [Planctomycetota bacterium]
MAPKPEPTVMEKIVSLCKRRGFVFQSSEIYGGLNSCWDYGPLGVELKRNVKDAWWRAVVQERDDVVGLDAAILMHPKVWEASGHLANFTDPLVDCKQCKLRHRADHMPGFDATKGLPPGTKCPNCGGELTEIRKFNLMFKTFMGAVEDSAATVYLRPETAQGIFVNFVNVQQATRKKLPFGIAQIGKAFRNEITPGNFTFRTREFEQMEIEYFVEPGTDEEWHRRWKADRMQWYLDLGMRKDRLQFREHGKDELAHYAKGCADIEYQFPFGWSELEGIANRTDFDLKQHTQYSGVQLTLFDEATKTHTVPYVIEPSAGADRSTLAFLVDAYDEEKDGDETRVLLRFHPRLAPIKVAVLPLVKKEGMPEKAMTIAKALRAAGITTGYDEGSAIGRRYRRFDEIGTPFAVTIDGDTLKDDTVTLRLRDTMEQTRVPAATIVDTIRERMNRMPR